MLLMGARSFANFRGMDYLDKREHDAWQDGSPDLTPEGAAEELESLLQRFTNSGLDVILNHGQAILRRGYSGPEAWVSQGEYGWECGCDE
jgi:hypothetical protein